MTDGQKFVEIGTGQGDDYATGYLLNYLYFTEHYKLTAMDLNKQQAPDADPKEIKHIDSHQQIDMAGWRYTIFFSLFKKQKKPFYIFLKERWKYYNVFLF